MAGLHPYLLATKSEDISPAGEREKDRGGGRLRWKRWLARWARQKTNEDIRRGFDRIFRAALGGDEEAGELLASVLAAGGDRRVWALRWAVFGKRELESEESLNRRLEEWLSR